jgi:hypothetical protein
MKLVDWRPQRQKESPMLGGLIFINLVIVKRRADTLAQYYRIIKTHLGVVIQISYQPVPLHRPSVWGVVMTLSCHHRAATRF